MGRGPADRPSRLHGEHERSEIPNSPTSWSRSLSDCAGSSIDIDLRGRPHGSCPRHGLSLFAEMLFVLPGHSSETDRLESKQDRWCHSHLLPGGPHHTTLPRADVGRLRPTHLWSEPALSLEGRTRRRPSLLPREVSATSQVYDDHDRAGGRKPARVHQRYAATGIGLSTIDWLKPFTSACSLMPGLSRIALIASTIISSSSPASFSIVSAMKASSGIDRGSPPL